MKKVGISTLIWGVCWLLGNLMSHVSAQESRSAEQNRTSEYVTTTEQSWRESAFYRTIVENNIFRPLGWAPSKPMPMYRLLGTVIATDGTRRQAILQEIASSHFYFLKVGDKVGDAVLREILPKQVKLDKSGQTIRLKLSILQFLSPTHTRGAGTSRSDPQTSTAQTYKSPTDQIRNVSKEERRRLIQRYYRK